jgi:hypothetical protein
MKKRRVIITKLPQAKSGAEVKLNGLRAGLGFNSNVMPWPIMAGKMSEPATEVNKTLKPVPRHMANLEAEKDEIAMIPDKGGIPSTFIIGGKRHHSGGTPLFLPSDSFIFSDTAKMRIKDPTILAQFGMPFKKGGYTPAEIAKKYDTSKYKKILADPNTDDLQRETAELMIANNNLKLAKLAIYQESMKGFPQGMPQVGMPYLEEMEIDPAQFVQENPGQGDDETAEADNMSRFGGPLPKAEWGKNTQSKMLPKFSEYSPNAGASDAYANVDTKEGTEGIAGVEGIEGKGLTGKYQDWEMTKKKKAGISGIAKAEGILGGLRGAQAFGNAREMLNLKQQMKDGSVYDNAVTAVQANEIGRQGSNVESGMATGTQNPYKTGNLDQQPGMNYAIEGMVKYGGNIDYFAPGGYLPRAQAGFINQMMDQELYPGASSQLQNAFGIPQAVQTSTQTGQDKYNQIDQWVKEEQAKEAQQDLMDELSISATNWLGIPKGSQALAADFASYAEPRVAYERKEMYKKENLKAVNSSIEKYNKEIENYDKEINNTISWMQNLKKDYETQPSWVMALEPSLSTVKDQIVSLRKKQQDIVNHVNNLKTKKQGIIKEPKAYKSQEEYQADLLSPYSAEKKQAQVNWLKAHPDQLAPYRQAADQSTIAGDIGKPANTSTAAPVTTATTTADAEGLKQNEALLKGAPEKATESNTEVKKAVVKKSSMVEETDEDFKEGGSTGKRRVLIHSLGEYRMGGALKTYEDGGKTTEAKGKGIWQHSTKSGNWRLKYSDGTYGPVQKETPLLVTPYKGADAPSKYTEEQWQEFAKETGFTPQSADPTEQNKEFQYHLAKHKDWGPKVAELHTKYGMPKDGKFDALLGKRWDALVDQRAPKKGVSETLPVKGDGKKQTYTDPGVYAENLKQPRVPNVPARFTVQDTLKGANLMADYLGVKRSPVWSAKPAFTTPNVQYLSPERQYQKIGEQFNIAAQNLAQFGDPRQYNARLGQLQGQALAAIADTAARTEGENVRIGNAQAAQNAAMFNAFNQGEAARRTKDYESNITADDVVKTERKFGRNAGVNQLANAFTNRANIYNINQLNPQFALDPTGMFYFKNPRDIKPDYSKQMTVNDYFNQILEKNENLRNEKGMTIAYDMAKTMAGTKPKTDETDEWLKASKGIIPSYNVNPYGYNDGQAT